MGQPCATTTPARTSVASPRTRRTRRRSASNARSTHGQLVDTRASNARQTTTQPTSRQLPELSGRAPTGRSFTTAECRYRIGYISTRKAQGQIMGAVTEPSTAWTIFRICQFAVGSARWPCTLPRRPKQQLWKHGQRWWEVTGLIWHVVEFPMERER